jgi:hypothetical protein
LARKTNTPLWKESWGGKRAEIIEALKIARYAHTCCV